MTYILSSFIDTEHMNPPVTISNRYVSPGILYVEYVIVSDGLSARSGAVPVAVPVAVAAAVYESHNTGY